MKTIISIFVGLVALFGYYALTHQQPVSLGDAVSIVANTKIPSNASTTVGIASTLLVATTTSRNYMLISNDSANVVYLSIGQVASLGKGIRLAASGTYEMKSGQNIFTAAIYGITTATSNVSYIESSKQ